MALLIRCPFRKTDPPLCRGHHHHNGSDDIKRMPRPKPLAACSRTAREWRIMPFLPKARPRRRQNMSSVHQRHPRFTVARSGSLSPFFKEDARPSAGVPPKPLRGISSPFDIVVTATWISHFVFLLLYLCYGSYLEHQSSPLITS